MWRYDTASHNQYYTTNQCVAVGQKQGGSIIIGVPRYKYIQIIPGIENSVRPTIMAGAVINRYVVCSLSTTASSICYYYYYYCISIISWCIMLHRPHYYNNTTPYVLQISSFSLYSWNTPSIYLYIPHLILGKDIHTLGYCDSYIPAALLRFPQISGYYYSFHC